MKKTIPVTSGTGTASTELAAFDAALYKAGIANYNLLKLSSIIPSGYEPKITKVNFNDKDFGDKLYVVMSSANEHEKDKEAWAGVGWVVTKVGIKRGLFVEHHGSDKQQVIRQIKDSLTDMISYRKENFGQIKYKVVGIKCQGQPVCALVAAIYQSESWE